MRVSGVTIPDNKRLEVGLTYLFGIGLSSSQEILKKANISFDKKAKDLTPEEEGRLIKIIQEYKIEGDLRREIAANIKRLKDISAYRGLRHVLRLPVRGQRTKTNSRTVRGNVRKTMTSGKRKVEKK